MFFDATGAVLLDTEATGFPTFDNGILGPSDQELGPNQTAQLSTLDVLPFLPNSQRPLQLEIRWSAAERVPTLDVTVLRVARQWFPATGQQGPERSRERQAMPDAKLAPLRLSK